MLKTPEHSDLRTCQDLFYVYSLCLGDLECSLVSGKTSCLIPAAVQSFCFTVQGELQNIQHLHIAWKRLIRLKITSRSLSNQGYVYIYNCCSTQTIFAKKCWVHLALKRLFIFSPDCDTSSSWLWGFSSQLSFSLRHTVHSREAQLSHLCCMCSSSRLKLTITKDV